MTVLQPATAKSDSIVENESSNAAPWAHRPVFPKGVLLRAAHPTDAAAVEALSAKVFGPGRFARTAYRLREKNVPVQACCHVCEAEERLIASVVFSPVTIGLTPALLLGPLAVEPAWKNQGLGLALMQVGLQAAHARLNMGAVRPDQAGAAASAALVILVGDLPYYARAGLCACLRGRWRCPVRSIPHGFWHVN
jgi:predicted N-acetyltransferase YhbS